MTDIVFAGVGGQGVILAGKIVMEVAKMSGYDVKESEIHGMAQRGGSVDCQVRFGEKVYSPLVRTGRADFVVALEELEAVRKLDYLAPRGILIVNRRKIEPVPVRTGAMEYPHNITGWVEEHVPNSKLVDTGGALKEAGSKRALNIVMLGVLSQYLPFEEDLWTGAIKGLVKERFIEMNIRAFGLGRQL